MKIRVLILSLVLCVTVNAQTFNLLWTKSNNITTNDDRARQCALDTSGIYIAGNDYQPGNNQWRIEKRNLYTGAVIWSQVVNPSAGNDYAQDIVLFNSALYISGYENITGSDYRWRLEKRNPLNGAIIWSQFSDPSGGGDVGFGVYANDSGVFMVGADYVAGKNQWRIERRDLITGTLIWSKNTDPATTGSTAQAYHVIADDSGVYVCGYDAAPGNIQWHIEKRNITTGDSIWIKRADYSSFADYAQDLTIDSSGLYVVGNDDSIASTDVRWRIEKRDLTTGNIIWVQTSNPSGFNDYANGVTKNFNYLYIGGTQGVSGSDTEWRIEKRLLSTGELLCSQTSNPSAFSGDNLSGIAVDSSGVYVSGHDVIASGNFEWHMEKYSLCVTGQSPVSSFTPSNKTICSGQCIDFADKSTSNPTIWNWTFQGGTPATSSLQHPSNICYNSAGTYNVTLITANGNGYNSSTQSITVQTCTGIQESNDLSRINISPNPSNGVFTIDCSGINHKLEITNILGKKVYAKLINSEKTEIDLSNHTEGIYFYQIIFNNNKIATGKLIIRE